MGVWAPLCCVCAAMIQNTPAAHPAQSPPPFSGCRALPPAVFTLGPPHCARIGSTLEPTESGLTICNHTPRIHSLTPHTRAFIFINRSREKHSIQSANLFPMSVAFWFEFVPVCLPRLSLILLLPGHCAGCEGFVTLSRCCLHRYATMMRPTATPWRPTRNLHGERVVIS